MTKVKPPTKICNGDGRAYTKVGPVSNTFTMQIQIGVPKNTQSKYLMQSLTEDVWEFKIMYCGITYPVWRLVIPHSEMVQCVVINFLV